MSDLLPADDGQSDSLGDLLPGIADAVDDVWAEVELVVADRADVLTIPNAALRTPADVHVAGGVVGLSTEQVDAMLAASTLPPKPGSSEGGAASGPGGMSEEESSPYRSR